ncbi:glycosyltransferase family 2 protein [Nocardioides sp.]|uniref:glycosyltransferase family 2 protein n=1 Tax=Nocardioides sp. TaxID=35761 RepID=UPI00260167B7|nr:glycosyltransferase family 2 protein [Nocardioides sp.]
MTGTRCAVVRVYNEATVLASVLRSLQPVVDEIICVDDGSSDGSAEIALAAGCTVVRHAINLGGGAALATGLHYALTRTEHEHVVNFDADGQHLPADAAQMLEVAKRTGVDVVLGTRNRHEATMPRSRRLLLRAALAYTRRTTGLRLTDTHNGLRVFNRHALRSIRLTQGGMAYASELESSISRAKLTWTEVPVSIVYNEYCLAKGQSNLNAVNIVYDLMLSRLQRAT